jgi:histone acetyltransferase (RNA polymerase elongator complex component)
MEGIRRGREMQEKYLRRVLRVDRETPNHIVREGVQGNRLRVVVAERERQSLMTKWMEGKSARY